MNSVSVKIEEIKKNITINGSDKISIDSKKYNYELIHLQNSTYLLKVNNKFFKIYYSKINSETLELNIGGTEIITISKSPLKEKAEQLVTKEKNKNECNIIYAPMPGIVLDIKVNVGDVIKKGNTLLILEAMKMENSIKSNYNGTIQEIFIKKNNPVEKGTKLLSII